jgi:hypothetical protein
LLPIAIQMVRDGKRGVYNFTNPGTMSHNEIMGMYRDIVDPTFTWKNFSVRKAKFMTVFFTCFFFFFCSQEEEQNKIVLAKRSNNYLDTSKLEREYPQVKSAKEALRECLLLVKKSIDEGTGPKPPPKPVQK